MRLGVDIRVISKLLQLDYATIIQNNTTSVVNKQTNKHKNKPTIALENERLIFA